MCVCVGQKMGLKSVELEFKAVLSHSVWVLRTQFWFFARSVFVLKLSHVFSLTQGPQPAGQLLSLVMVGSGLYRVHPWKVQVHSVFPEKEQSL